MSRYGKSPLNNPKLDGISVAILCLTSLTALADTGLSANPYFQIHGFLTQAYVKTTENRFFGDSEDGSFEFRELGINASYRFNPRLMASTQLLSRTAGDMYDGSPTLDYAQLDFTLGMHGSDRYGLLVGRNKSPLGLYNDTRDVAATRPGIFMPQAIYWDRVRNMVLSNDGAQLYAEKSYARHRIDLRFFSGKTPIDENVEKTYVPIQLDASVDQKDLTLGGRMLYEWDGGRFRLALSGAFLKMGGHTDLLPEGSVDLDYWVISSQLNQGPWRLTGEYMEEPLDYQGFGRQLDNLDTTVNGYYLQGDYRLHEDWELMVRYEESHYDKYDTDGSKNSAVYGLKPYNLYSKLWTAGLLWEPTENLMLRAEFSRVEGTFFLSFIENQDLTRAARDWNLLSLLISYSF